MNKCMEFVQLLESPQFTTNPIIPKIFFTVGVFAGWFDPQEKSQIQIS